MRPRIFQLMRSVDLATFIRHLSAKPILSDISPFFFLTSRINEIIHVQCLFSVLKHPKHRQEKTLPFVRDLIFCVILRLPTFSPNRERSPRLSHIRLLISDWIVVSFSQRKKQNSRTNLFSEIRLAKSSSFQWPVIPKLPTSVASARGKSDFQFVKFAIKNKYPESGSHEMRAIVSLE